MGPSDGPSQGTRGPVWADLLRVARSRLARLASTLSFTKIAFEAQICRERGSLSALAFSEPKPQEQTHPLLRRTVTEFTREEIQVYRPCRELLVERTNSVEHTRDVIPSC